MRTHRLGARQRAVLLAMRDGEPLYRSEDADGWVWYIGTTRQAPRPIVALHVHGYVMFDTWQGGRGYYALTEQGRAAVSATIAGRDGEDSGDF